MPVGQFDQARDLGLPFPKHGTWEVSRGALVVLFIINTEKRDDCYLLFWYSYVYTEATLVACI